MIVPRTDQPGNQVTMLRSGIPIELSSDLDLLIELAGSHNRNGDGNAVVQRGGNPGVVAASRGTRNSNTFWIHPGTRKQISEGALRLIFRDSLLRHANQERLYAAMIARRHAALTLSKWIPGQHDESKSCHIDTEGLKIRMCLTVGPPVPHVKQDGWSGTVGFLRKIQMSGHAHSRKRLPDKLFDAVTRLLNGSYIFNPQIWRPRQPPPAERIL